jgi:hypothetical protein
MTQRVHRENNWSVRLPYVTTVGIIIGRQQGMHSFGGERELIGREVQVYRYKIQIRDRGHF